MQQGLTIDYLNRLHNDLSKEQVNLVEEMKRTSTFEQEKAYTRQITMLNQLLLQVLKFRNLKRQVELEANY